MERGHVGGHRGDANRHGRDESRGGTEAGIEEETLASPAGRCVDEAADVALASKQKVVLAVPDNAHRRPFNNNFVFSLRRPLTPAPLP